MADTKSTSKTTASGDKSESSKGSDTAGWQVVTQRVDLDGNNVSTRTFQFDGPASEVEARKQVEADLGENVSVVQLNKLS